MNPAVEFGYTESEDLRLRPLKEEDKDPLYRIAMNPKIKHLWAPDAELLSPGQYHRYLERRIAHRWAEFFVVEAKDTGSPIGFAYCYNASESNGVAYLSICLSHECKGSILAMRALYLYISHLFVDRGYRKLYAEVFDYNEACLNLVKKCDFKEEGYLSEHQYWQSRFWGVHILSMNRSEYDRLCQSRKKLLNKLACKRLIN